MNLLNPVSAYRLAPMQQGLLYHLFADPASGVDVEQILGRLREDLDAVLFTRAWERVMERYQVLRTTFRWEGLDEPRQEVHASMAVSLEREDWRGLSPQEQDKRLESFLEADRRRGFDLERGPLFRLALFEVGPAEHRFVWTFLHALMDGRSFPLVLREVFLFYEAFQRGEDVDLPSPRPYSSHIRWLEQVDASRSESFWREELRGFVAPTALGIEKRAGEGGQGGRGERSIRLPPGFTACLRGFADQRGVTVSTLVQGAWALLLGRYSGEEDVVFGAIRACRRSGLDGADSMVGVFMNTLPVRVHLPPDAAVGVWLDGIRAAQLAVREHEHSPLLDVLRWSEVPKGSPLFETILVYDRSDLSSTLRRPGGAWERREFELRERTSYPLTVYAYAEPEMTLKIAYDRGRYADDAIERALEHLRTLLEGLVADPALRLADVSLLSDGERRQLLVDWNQGYRQHASDDTVHGLFEAQVARTPERPAVVFRDERLTYRELDRRADQLARFLRRAGAGPGSLVGLHLDRSADILIGLLGILKSGAAYVPLDLDYPRERLQLMVDDARPAAILTRDRWASRFAGAGAKVIRLDADREEIEREPIACEGASPPQAEAAGRDLAYVIYTSGSTGRPKGVMVTHRNAVSCFAGIDGVVDHDPPGIWLAVTGISFDISVLELLWTLTRGFTVVLGNVREIASLSTTRDASARRGIELSLYYFASDDGAAASDKYRLLLEGARFADRHGFSAVWTPERHFHPFGGLYPNPSVASAALAAITERIQIRAGSVVLPLHHPVRVAEEWSLVDNLSKGRVGISFASGWHSSDFVFSPESYAVRHEVMYRDIETVRRLWRGEAVSLPGGTGAPVEVRIYPRPVQPELPVWITAGGAPETFRAAGAIGANLLTHLLGQTLESLEGKIALYREAWWGHGRGPGEGRVTLMLHTFVGVDAEAVRRKVREPFLRYLRSSSDLARRFLESLEGGLAEGPSGADMEAAWDRAFERYFETSGLFGTPDMCLATVDRLRAAGVDEVACLIDFGVDVEDVLFSLELLKEVKDRSNEPREASPGASMAETIRKNRVTHMQCTPSLAKILLLDRATREALGSLRVLLLGGEALPEALLEELGEVEGRKILNMYGPTETTIWSTSARVDGCQGTVPIGRPLSNTEVFVLDRHLSPVPVGVPGELCIGGDGVAAGYLRRSDLTRERFVPSRLSRAPGGRLYRTGDLVRFQKDGTLEFLGRTDHQVKIRGHRVELGEIEGALRQHSDVRDCVVVATEDAAGDRRLAAYFVRAGAKPPATDGLRRFLSDRLPEPMVPASFVELEAFPLTPSGKIDRRALPRPQRAGPAPRRTFSPPRTPIEEALVRLWAEALSMDQIGIEDNFFDLGGNSLSAVRIFFKIREELRVELPLRTFFEAPTIAALARRVDDRLVEKLVEEVDASTLDDLVEEVERLSDEEARGALEKEPPPPLPPATPPG